MITWKKIRKNSCSSGVWSFGKNISTATCSCSKHHLYSYMLWDCFQVSCFPGANHWIEFPWCAGMFRKAWALPGGIRQNPPGCQGCALQPMTAERGSWLCKGPPATLWAPTGHMVDTNTLRTSPQHPWNTETERVLGSPIFIDSTFGQRMMGWFGTSVRLFFWSQGVLDEIESGAWTRNALAGELICRNNAFVNLGHQRKKNKSMQQSIFQRLLMKTGHLPSLQCIC